MTPKFYVITYPESYWLIPTYIHQFNKYVPDTECVIMCYEYPELDIDLPENVSIVSITDGQPQGGSNNWASSIRKYLETLDEDYVTFSLDDFIICDHLDLTSFQKDMKKVKEYDIKRYVLGATSSMYDLSEWNGFLRFNDKSEYRISCQVSVWNREYLIKYLKDGWNPWDFECTGSVESQTDDVNLVYKDTPVLRCIYNGAVSRRYGGRVNVLGMKFEDIKHHIEHGDFKEKNLLYGTEPKPQLYFEAIGYNFNMNMLKPHYNSQRFKIYQRYYADIYK